MRYYLDTEFNGFGGELLSIALAPADTRKSNLSATCLYINIKCEEPLAEWVAFHVAPHLDKVPVDNYLGSLKPVSREKAARITAQYLRNATPPGATATIVADWPEDFAYFMNLFIIGPGRMVKTPDFDCEYRSMEGFNTADHSTIPHNALADAIALRDHWESVIASY